jgi:hypothetical protein
MATKTKTPTLEDMKAILAANPAMAAALAPAIRQGDKTTRTEPGLHVVPVTQADRNRNIVGKCRYVATHTTKGKNSQTFTVCIDAALVRIDAGEGVKVSTGYNPIFGVSGSTASSLDEMQVYNRLAAQHSAEIAASLSAQYAENVASTPYLTKEERKALKGKA